MSHFPLNLAQLCQDCSEVGDNPLQCPTCASRASLALAPVLNRGSGEREIGSRWRREAIPPQPDRHLVPSERFAWALDPGRAPASSPALYEA